MPKHFVADPTVEVVETLPGFEEAERFDKRVGISPATRKRWAERGKLVITRIGRKDYVDLVASAQAWRTR